MKFLFASFGALALLSASLAHPTTPGKRQSPPASDVEFLQFALGLEFLQIALYKDALSKFSPRDFPPSYFSALLDIQFDDQFHAALLHDALDDIGVKPDLPCVYTFSFHSAQSFVSLASTIEGIISGAYSGSAASLKTPELSENAENILPIEGVHNALQRAQAGQNIISNPRGQPLTPNEVTTLLAPFIVSCPSTNTVLPFKAGPPLIVLQPGPFVQRKLASFAVPKAQASKLPSPFFVTFISGTNTKTSLPIDINLAQGTFKAAIGDNMAGQTYVVVSNTNTNGTLTDAVIVFGPAAIEVVPLPRNISAFDNLD